MHKLWLALVVAVVGVALGLGVAGCSPAPTTGRMGGDKMGDKMGDNKMGDKMTGDKMTGDKMGDKMEGDKMADKKDKK
jgi:hypothetical protein